jgi:hypothetical protein
MFRIWERTETSPKIEKLFYHNINLTTNYQLLLNCNKVHRVGRVLKCKMKAFEHEVGEGCIPMIITLDEYSSVKWKLLNTMWTKGVYQWSSLWMSTQVQNESFWTWGGPRVFCIEVLSNALSVTQKLMTKHLLRCPWKYHLEWLLAHWLCVWCTSIARQSRDKTKYF